MYILTNINLTWQLILSLSLSRKKKKKIRLTCLEICHAKASKLMTSSWCQNVAHFSYFLDILEVKLVDSTRSCIRSLDSSPPPPPKKKVESKFVSLKSAPIRRVLKIMSSSRCQIVVRAKKRHKKYENVQEIFHLLIQNQSYIHISCITYKTNRFIIYFTNWSPQLLHVHNMYHSYHKCMSQL